MSRVISAKLPEIVEIDVPATCRLAGLQYSELGNGTFGVTIPSTSPLFKRLTTWTRSMRTHLHVDTVRRTLTLDGDISWLKDCFISANAAAQQLKPVIELTQSGIADLQFTDPTFTAQNEFSIQLCGSDEALEQLQELCRG